MLSTEIRKNKLNVRYQIERFVVGTKYSNYWNTGILTESLAGKQKGEKN